MLIYYPSLISSAIFFGLIIINLHDKNFPSALLVSLVAVPVLLFLTYLSQNNLDILAYALILLPIYLIYRGYMMGANIITNSTTPTNPTNPVVPTVPERIEPEHGSSVCIKCNKVKCVCPVKNA